MNDKTNPIRIKQQASSLRECASLYINSCNKICNDFIAISDILSTDNVYLVKSLNNFVETFSSLITKIDKNFNDVADSMDKWADLTISCENDSKERLQKISNGLNDVGALLNRLK